MAHHGSVTDPSNLHRSYAWEYADAITRTSAIGFVPVDVGKAARQLDTNSIWMLTDDSPITWVQIGGPVTAYTDEQVRDVVGAALVAGANVSIAVNDPSDTITIAATDTNTTDPEVVRDTIASALVAGSGITITPNDPADTITIASTGSYTDEQAQDAVGSILTDSASIDLTYNDAANTITAATIFGTTATTVAAGNHTHAAGATTVKVGLTANIDGGGSVITTTQAAYVKVPFACTVTGWEVNADVSGSISVPVSRAATATPTTFAAISGTSPPALSSAQTNKDVSIAGDWTDVTLDEGDWLKFGVSGTPASVKLVAIALDLERLV